MKKKTAAMVLAALMAFSMTACGNGSTQKEDDSTAADQETTEATETADNTAADDTASGDETVELHWLNKCESDSEAQIWQQVADLVHEKYPNITVTIENTNWTSYWTKLPVELASGNAPDLIYMHFSRASDYTDSMLPISDYIEKDEDINIDEFYSGILDSFIFDDQVYALPYDFGPYIMYYNKDLFEKAGVKEFPETWTEFLDAIKKLKASGVIPIAMGTQTTYMAGHLHDQIFYKWLGTDAAKKLGSRDMKWTDPEVVETLQFVQDLIDAGAFDKNAAGMTDNIAMTQFQQGEAAMVITGPWNIGTFEDPAETPVCDSIEVAKFPYFEEKPEFKNEDMQTLSPYMISGKLEGKELELTLELVKMLTDKDAAKRFAEEAAFLIPRTDIDLDESAISPLFAKNVELGGTSEGIGVDVFDFDPLASMQDRTRNSISSMFTGEKPDSVAKEIQSEIDK